ncbi:MAG: phenylalanyl-tRNA synthetase subunit alpha [Cytophagaceae bacterium]|jgi:Mlc titration factor MtfA (ptsG expression regulator)|nr:phenylalanyl-tRNA synthetase subunit alpha [Cytophagaceae bacterium]
MIYLIILAVIFFGLLYYIKRPKSIAEATPAVTETYRDILLKEVDYYEQLPEEEKEQFEKRIHLFLHEKKITGVDVEADEHTKVLVAASAVIPAFAFDDYNYPMIREVLLYSNTFDDSFLHPNREMKQDRISGMVGEGPLSQVVMLSKPDLIRGFQNKSKPHNVGIHEFTHLLDKTDGTVDGIPEHLMDRKFIAPWIEEMEKEVRKIRSGSSDIPPYALTNHAEFLAVASEYFFVAPSEFKKKHPELLAYLQKIFRQEVSEEGVQPID